MPDLRLQLGGFGNLDKQRGKLADTFRSWKMESVGRGLRNAEGGECMRVTTKILFVLLLCDVVAAGDPKPLLHPIFGDGAVLQRGKPVTIWGWANDGATVRIQLEGPGSKLMTAVAAPGEDGLWRAKLPPMPAGGPFELCVTGGDMKTVVKDVLIGDVYLCSGQSNMGYTLKTSGLYDKEIKEADYAHIRQFSFTGGIETEPISVPRVAQWRRCSPETAGGFSAVGFFMARKLHRDLGVPVGIVLSFVGGTNIDAWISEQSMARMPEAAGKLSAWKRLVSSVYEQKRNSGMDYPELMKLWYESHDPGSKVEASWSTKDLPVSEWAVVHMPGDSKSAGAVPADWSGTTWLRRHFEMPAESSGKPARLRFSRIDDRNTVWLNGSKIGENKVGRNINYDVPANCLQAGINTIAVRLLGSNASIAIAPESTALITSNAIEVPLAGKWHVRQGVSLALAPKPPVAIHPGPFGAYITSLYNGMIAPLGPYTLAGIVWYQGENNVHEGYAYRPMLATLIGDWRSHFGQGEIPFFIIGLPRWGDEPAQPGECRIAELRQAQADVARTVPKSYLINTIDLGDPKDVHPRHKQQFGIRAAVAIEVETQGVDLSRLGPWYRDMSIEGTSIRITFANAEGGLKCLDDRPLGGFAIAGEDKVFVWGEARIDGESVVVSSSAVAKPIAVRYCWSSSPPVVNLVNGAGMVAVPFRTDDWPMTGRR
jgi:sialate O-acetylesterase